MSRSAPTQVLMLAGPQTIREATQTRARLLAALENGQDLAIDCAAVTEVDLCFIQILLAASRSAGAHGGAVSLCQAPTGLVGDILVRGGFWNPNFGAAPTDPAKWQWQDAG